MQGEVDRVLRAREPFAGGVGRITRSTDPTRVGDAPFAWERLRDAELAIGERGFDGRSAPVIWTDAATS